MTRVVIVAFILLLTACAPLPKIVNGSASSVIVYHEVPAIYQGAGSLKKATDMAAKHCAQYGKDIRLIHTQGWTMSFDCI